LQTNQAWYAWQTLTGRRDADPSDNVACVAARVVPCKTPPDSKVRQAWVTRPASFSAGGPANEMEIQNLDSRGNSRYSQTFILRFQQYQWFTSRKILTSKFSPNFYLAEMSDINELRSKKFGNLSF
jgi:hypothetical protein